MFRDYCANLTKGDLEHITGEERHKVKDDFQCFCQYLEQTSGFRKIQEKFDNENQRQQDLEERNGGNGTERERLINEQNCVI